MHVGDSLRLALVHSAEQMPKVMWWTSDSTVATVSGTGLVKGLAAGTATIGARARGYDDATATVVVVDTLPPAPAPAASGIWISRGELAALPTSGTAWNNLKATADSDCGVVDLTNQDQNNDVCILAKALVYARTGSARHRDDVLTALRSLAAGGTYNGRALALGRNLIGYVIAADLIQLQTLDPALDGSFRTKIRSLLTTYTSSGPANLIECHELRPNNWGTHCGASRAAVAAYLNDAPQLTRIAQVFRGWLGDRAAYSGFKFGSDLTWQCDAMHPTGINPRGCTKAGQSIDGVLPDDQRRGGSFRWPPGRENYVYEALQGALAQAVILSRRGYDMWSAQDRALLRAFQWLHAQAQFPASGDDGWQPYLINKVYGVSFPAPLPARPGKNVGWTDWTHH